ncbi:DinB family protein [Deinococcus sp. KNUC1210]|uniref:DinB family protein n=1 Tax=Deinococcus sp. KNUC1210 TaxID=2917691 RepID=UPI001EF1253B|nr:DinB family protein [Deinococcus sp. KNUC1210]ULH15036.1 DinB family protein [Deinococcus sp. KNUC1210]
MTALTPAQLSRLLDEAFQADWESLHSALRTVEGQPHPRIGWLTQHLSVTKRGYWQALSEVLPTASAPPELDLDGLCRWEVAAAAALTPEQLKTPLTYSGTPMTVGDLLRVNIRHTVWHAGQIAALGRAPRMA